MVRKLIRINSLAVVVLAAFFFSYPPVRAVLDIGDAALREPGTPKVVWRLYSKL